MEHDIFAALEESGAGVYDGNEFGDGYCTIYCYTHNAEQLCLELTPIVTRSWTAEGAYAIVRPGEPGTSQRIIELSPDKGNSGLQTSPRD